MKEIELIFTQLREKLATAETAQRRDMAIDTAQLIPYTQSGKTYLTKKFSPATVQLSGGNATVPTAVSFSAYVPTNASSVLLQIAFIPNADQASAYVYSYDLSSVTLWGDAASGANNIYAQVSASTLDGGFGYVVSNVGDELNVYALGFTL